jgi:flagellar basal body-associated protein FliL
MDRFELTIVAQGSQSIWVALLVVALVCATVIAIAASFTASKLWQGNARSRKKRC